MARGAAERGKRIALGDGTTIRWDHNSEAIFRGNPNIANPLARYPADTVEWVPFYKGHRIYNEQRSDHWQWNYDFVAIPGEIFLSAAEHSFAEQVGRGYVVIEPNVPARKGGGYLVQNKQWPIERYQEVVNALREDGADVVQLVGAGPRYLLSNVRQIATANFRLALAVLERAALYIGTEGGMHHGAAAVDIPAVVLFGGWVPPEVLGYDTHTNLTGGATEACGLFRPCEHCQQALQRISTDEVLAAAHAYLG